MLREASLVLHLVVCKNAASMKFPFRFAETKLDVRMIVHRPNIDDARSRGHVWTTTGGALEHTEYVSM